MSSLKLTKKEVSGLLATSAVLPILCFVLGAYTANQWNSNNASSDAINNNLTNIEQPKSPAKLAPTAEAIQTLSNIASTSPTSMISETIEATQIQNIELPFVVQAGSFSSYSNAVKFQNKLQEDGLNTRVINDEHNHQAVYRLIVDEFRSQQEAEEFRDNIRKTYQWDLYVAHREKERTSNKVAVL